MSRTGIALGIGVFACAIAVAAQQKKVERSCSAASLNGNYGFSMTGTNTRISLPFAFVGLMTADGAGNLTVKGSQSRGGRIVRGAGVTGTYKVLPTCTGTAALRFDDDTPGSLEFVIVDDGKQVLF